MRFVYILAALLFWTPAWANDGLILPGVDFSATAVHEAGAFESKETVYYSAGKLRIDRGHGFSTTILDLNTQTQYLLMVNHTYLVLPMDDELFRRYIARTVVTTGARRIGTERVEGLQTTKYAFGNDGALDAAGIYWLTISGVMVKREYEDGVFGRNVRHLELLRHLVFGKQPASLFSIPPGFTRAR